MKLIDREGTIDLGESMGFAQVDVLTEAVVQPLSTPEVPPQTAAPHERAVQATEMANRREAKLLQQVGDLVTDQEIDDKAPAAAQRMVEVMAFDIGRSGNPLITRFMSAAERLDDAKVHELAEVVEETEFLGKRWVVTEVRAQWKDGDRKVIVLAKQMK